MPDRHYTIMIVPGSRAKILRLRVRKSVLAAIVSVAAFGLVGTALLPILYYSVARRTSQLSELRKENRTLRAASEEIASLREQVAFFENKANKFALMAGVESIPSADGGGGLRQEPQADLSIVKDEIDNLKERSGVLRESFSILEKVYQDQSLLLANTPSIAPVKGMIAYGYAWRKDPFTGERAFHKGLDIVAPRGTRIKSPADGVVIKASREPGYGNVIYVSHGNGLVTRYAHLDGFSVRPGQDIGRGEVIGYVGNTGRSLGAHLHYEVLVNNTKVDPSQYILDDTVSY
ncbi:MAG: M23 family metallopeptidase [Candidatus Polarisedimenticolia bacterium]